MPHTSELCLVLLQNLLPRETLLLVLEYVTSGFLYLIVTADGKFGTILSPTWLIREENQ